MKFVLNLLRAAQHACSYLTRKPVKSQTSWDTTTPRCLAWYPPFVPCCWSSDMNRWLSSYCPQILNHIIMVSGSLVVFRDLHIHPGLFHSYSDSSPGLDCKHDHLSISKMILFSHHSVLRSCGVPSAAIRSVILFLSWWQLIHSVPALCKQGDYLDCLWRDNGVTSPQSVIIIIIMVTILFNTIIPLGDRWSSCSIS